MRNGVVTYAVSRGENNDEGFIRQIKGGRNRLLANLGAAEAADNPDGANTYGFEEISEECEGELPEACRPPTPGRRDAPVRTITLLRVRADLMRTDLASGR